MSIERTIDSKRIPISESFDALEIGEILPETPEYKAILDIVRMARIKDEIAWGNFPDMGSLSREIEREKEEFLTENANNKKCLNIFYKVYGWIEEAYGESVVRGYFAFKFLKEKYGVNNKKRVALF